MNTRTIFAYILSGLVLIITLMALLSIWDIIDWAYFRQYFSKTLKSLIVIAISAVVIYVIQSLFMSKDNTSTRDEK